MADAGVSPPSYVKYAFTDQHNLVLLFGAACFSLAFASPIPLAVGLGAELLWLLVGPRLPAFRDWVDGKLSLQYLARAEIAIQGALAELTDAEVARFAAVSQGCSELVSEARARKALPARQVQLTAHGLLELRRTFLDYQFLAQRVVSLVDSALMSEGEKEVARLQEDYTAERELTARMTIRQSLTAVQKRLQQQQELASIHRTIETRLEMLEKAVPYLKGRLADSAFRELALELDKCIADVGPAEALEQAVDDTFDMPAPSPSV